MIPLITFGASVPSEFMWVFTLTAFGLGAASRYGDTASRVIDQEGGWSGFVQNFLLGGVFLKIQYQVIEGIDSFGGLLLAPVTALGQGMVMLGGAQVGRAVAVLDAGTAATVESFTNGVASLLGPLAQPTAVGVAMISVAVFILAVNRLNISPLSFLQAVRS